MGDKMRKSNTAAQQYVERGLVEHERNILAMMTDRNHRQLWASPRRYSEPKNAARKAAELLVSVGKPGDRIAISHAITGLEIGWMRIGVGGNISGKWIWDTPPKLALTKPATNVVDFDKRSRGK